MRLSQTQLFKAHVGKTVDHDFSTISLNDTLFGETTQDTKHPGLARAGFSRPRYWEERQKRSELNALRFSKHTVHNPVPGAVVFAFNIRRPLVYPWMHVFQILPDSLV